MFPTDLYMLEGLIAQLGRGHTLRLVDPAHICSAVDEGTAVVVLQHVSYASGALHDMRGVTAAAHAQCAPCQALPLGQWLRATQPPTDSSQFSIKT